MLNNFVCVGKLIKDIEEIEIEGKTQLILTLSIPRSYKNANGEYANDIIPFILWSGIADTTNDLLKIGDIIGIKGRLQNLDTKLVAVAEKISFLNNKKEDK